MDMVVTGGCGFIGSHLVDRTGAWIVDNFNNRLEGTSVKRRDMWPFKREHKHVHEFKVFRTGKAIITKSWFGGHHKTTEEVVATLLVCSCGERKATLEDLKGAKQEVNPMFLDFAYDSQSMCASGIL